MNKHDLDIQKILFPSLRFERNYFKIRFPPNRSSEFFFLDIKMCIRAIGNYNMSFVSGLVRAGICINFPNFPKEKMENLISSACLKKSILPVKGAVALGKKS